MCTAATSRVNRGMTKVPVRNDCREKLDIGRKKRHAIDDGILVPRISR